MNNEKIPSLHSRYNPVLEAKRYIDSLSLSEKCRYCILIEPGMGYMIAPLRERLPSAKIIALHAGTIPLAETSLVASCPAADSQWFAELGIPIQDFLEREINDTEAAEIRILEWRPALAVYGQAYRTLIEESVEFVKRADANARTTKAFGKIWFRNFFRNLKIVKKIVLPKIFSVPVLVTGAGPGLEGTIPLISREFVRKKFFILAVSSSAAVLEARGIIPDMIISTDGGNWARYHLYECFRNSAFIKNPLAVSVTAALPSQCGALPVLPISDGSAWQTVILKELGIPFIIQPMRGTVSAAALDLAFGLTKDDIYISGIDLENRDILSHARPYSLDRFMEDAAEKRNPYYSQAFKRSGILKAGGSYGIYAAWFEKQKAAYSRRLHSLGGNNPLFGSIGALPPETADETTVDKKAPAGFTVFEPEKSDNTGQKALDILIKALTETPASTQIREELKLLLFADKAETSGAEIIDYLRKMAANSARFF